MIDTKGIVILLNDIGGDEAEDIKRCLTTLYLVREGEQPLDRSFGLSQEFLDQPENVARNILALEIIEKTKQYEKRVTVEKVEYQTGSEGETIPVVYLKRGDL
ncbi:MAG: hypothetical protein NC416_16975 [Eubacterium sp.]|nr:hypothetical protein [Eubacterium sp.]